MALGPPTGVSKGWGQVDSDQAALHRGGDKQLGMICGLESTQAVPDRSAGRPTAEPRQRMQRREVVTCHVTVISWLHRGPNAPFLSASGAKW